MPPGMRAWEPALLFSDQPFTFRPLSPAQI